ncbi:hypothetical protein M885DRAFT_526217 [Pelagophyceae sp. CCMP2097]|nr:hypothetical protein M885DRAFT_526217 [Pelagophyceae sp. CCMP2097]|mmetsp:Transcript_4014/g.14045  ORF Transcript_4014/g.14045 Transcript_4014/m.14045 type:complete len:552 (+) Transcript_4014:61-1716(+)
MASAALSSAASPSSSMPSVFRAPVLRQSQAPGRSALSAMELEALNVSSVECTRRIERARARRHRATVALQTLREAVSSRQRDLFALRGSAKANAAPAGGAPQLSAKALEARRAALRVKASSGANSLLQLRAQVDHLRLEKLRTNEAYQRSQKDLGKAKLSAAALKRQLSVSDRAQHSTHARLEALMLATLDECHHEAPTESPLQLITAPVRRSESEAPALTAGLSAVEKKHNVDLARADLATSQQVVRTQAAELHRLIDDHVAAKTAMATLATLRDECGLESDAAVISEFQGAEEANYDLCREVNVLLRDVVLLEKEQSVVQHLLEEERLREVTCESKRDKDSATLRRHATGAPSPPRGAKGQPSRDDSDASLAAEIAALEAKTAAHNKAALASEQQLQPCHALVADLLVTLASKPKAGARTPAADADSAPRRDLVGVLSHVEDRVDLVVRLLGLEAAKRPVAPLLRAPSAANVGRSTRKLAHGRSPTNNPTSANPKARAAAPPEPPDAASDEDDDERPLDMNLVRKRAREAAGNRAPQIAVPNALAHHPL